jgi:hypothetical protein
MRSITRHKRRFGLLSAVVVVTAGGLLLAGSELGTSATGGPAPAAVEARQNENANPGPTTELLGAGFTPWAINDFLLFTQQIQTDANDAILTVAPATDCASYWNTTEQVVGVDPEIQFGATTVGYSSAGVPLSGEACTP